MPIKPPPLDTRRYQDLLEEALARIPVHTPEWTHRGPADPGIALLELFAHLGEALIYRSNQIPERHRYRFLELLGLPLAPAVSARGLATIANERELAAGTLVEAGLEARAGEVPFRTRRALDALPIEARLYLKRALADEDGERQRRYEQLYASLKAERPDTRISLYQTVAWDGAREPAVDLGQDTIDGCLWIALLTRGNARGDMEALRAKTRRALAGKTLSLGIVPAPADTQRRMAPVQTEGGIADALLRFDAPRLPAGGLLPREPAPRDADYRPLDTRPLADVLLQAGIVEIDLPSAPEELGLWSDLDPLEAGSGQFPPALDDTHLAERVVTWIRVSSSGASVRLGWVGINAVEIEQRDAVIDELLADGNGEPDQVRVLARPPVLPDSVQLQVTDGTGAWQPWRRVTQLGDAAPEIHVANSRTGPWAGAPMLDRAPAEANVFVLDAESGTLRFGDGLRGRRPPRGARLRVSYDHSRGAAGNVAAGAVKTAPGLPTGMRIINPLRTWGGVAAESPAEGEKQIARHLQHGDRLVTVADFEAITRRTPGIEVGRVDVLPSFHPDLAPDAPGNSAGTVTLLLIPAYDAAHPRAPEPDGPFMDAVCRHLDPRRLVTTELILRGPTYRDLWIGVGIEVLAGGAATAEVREAVKRRIVEFLAPLRAAGLAAPETSNGLGELAGMSQGWPLRRAVSAAELTAVASRVDGVRFVKAVRLAGPDGVETSELAMHGLELPRIAGIAVVVGDAPSPQDLLRAPPTETKGGGSGAPARLVPVPVVPETC